MAIRELPPAETPLDVIFHLVALAADSAQKLADRSRYGKFPNRVEINTAALQIRDKLMMAAEMLRTLRTEGISTDDDFFEPGLVQDRIRSEETPAEQGGKAEGVRDGDEVAKGPQVPPVAPLENQVPLCDGSDQGGMENELRGDQR